MVRLWDRCIESSLCGWAEVGTLWSGYGLDALRARLVGGQGVGTLWSSYGSGALRARLVGRCWGQLSGFSLVGGMVMGLTVEAIGSERWVTLEGFEETLGREDHGLWGGMY
ncbi:hypothetical protein FKM82_013022 [Ascaphus truei]